MAGDELYNEILKSCVWIYTPEGWGSGSLIDPDKRLVLTCQHVANRQSEKIWVFFPISQDGKLVTNRQAYLPDDNKDMKEKPENAIAANCVDEQTSCDLALLQLNRLPAGVKGKPLRLSQRKVRPGQTLHTVGGNPEGNAALWIYSSGSVRQISVETWHYKDDGIEHRAEIVRSDVSMNHGDSGGAVVDNRGYLVGVNALAAKGVLNSGHIHVHEVRRFLQTAYRQKLDKEFEEIGDHEAASVSVKKKVDDWLNQLKADIPDKRKEAANELGKIGPDAKKAAIPLLKIVRSSPLVEPEAVRRAADEALKEIGAPEPEYLDKLLDPLKDKSCCKPARCYAALSLGSFRKALGFFPEDKQKQLFEALKDALQDDDAQVRENAAIALQSYRKQPAGIDEGYTELMECLRDTEERVRKAAYAALHAGGPPDTVPSSVVRELLQGEKFNKNPTREARYWGVYLLIRKFKEQGLPLIVEALEQEKNFDDVEFMIYVVREIRDFRLNSLEVGTILSKALDHRHLDVVNAAIDTMGTLRGYEWDKFVTPDENTVEALIKICIKFSRARKQLGEIYKKEYAEAKRKFNEAKKKQGEQFNEDAYSFPYKIKERCSTFSGAKGRLGFKSSDKLVEILSKAVGESDDLARRVAVNCLERIAKDKETAKAAPVLKAALLKEKSADVRIEILAALAALGKAGREALGEDKEHIELHEELDKWINDVHEDNHVVRVMASLAMTSLYPDQKQSSAAYRVLAQALLLKHADLDIDPIQMARFSGVRLKPGRPKPNIQEKELHQRAKQALSHGGVQAGEAVCRVLETNLWSIGADKLDVLHDKIHARIAAFQVLGQIGPNLTTSTKLSVDVRRQIDKALRLNKGGKEDSRVADAARVAKREIYK
ncbi:MAG TPA: HEAT repeat domain-containing protein [Gemmataceae bacterium]|nr:HEAT repeat domain-containing protein [Gemmataceae bacterium]